MAVSYRQEAHEIVDKLPDSAITDSLTWMQSSRDRRQVRDEKSSDFTPVALGGLWQGIYISEEDIASVRQEMWAGFDPCFNECPGS